MLIKLTVYNKHAYCLNLKKKFNTPTFYKQILYQRVQNCSQLVEILRLITISTEIVYITTHNVDRKCNEKFFFCYTLCMFIV